MNQSDQRLLPGLHVTQKCRRFVTGVSATHPSNDRMVCGHVVAILNYKHTAALYRNTNILRADS